MQIRKIIYYGPAQQDLNMTFTLNKHAPAAEVFPTPEGLAVRTSGNKAKGISWSAAVQALGEVMAASPELRRDLRALLDSVESQVPPASMGGVLAEVAAERERQISKGYDAAHDDQHTDGELATAAGLIALSDYDLIVDDGPADTLAAVVLDRHDDARGRLIIVAALIVAEIERLDRASTPTSAPE